MIKDPTLVPCTLYAFCVYQESAQDKREDSRQRVFMFNNKIKTEIGPEKLNHFFDVSETILQLIHEKKIF